MASEGASSATRDLLLESAKRVMQRDGAGNLTLDSVAKEAGVSKGGLLYHFPSKHALLRGMVAKGVGYAEQEMMESIGSHADPGDFTCAFVRHSLFGPKDPSCKPPTAIIWSVLAAAANEPALLEPVRECHQRWQNLLEGDGIDPDVATLIRLVGHGLWSTEIFGFAVPDAAQRERLMVLLCRMAGVEDAFGSQSNENTEDK